MTKRIFDILFSGFFLIILFPFGCVMAVWIALDSPGGVFFYQRRVGKDEKTFLLWKFRTMRPNSEGAGQLTVGASDARITRAGAWLRKFKLDELPQLINVFKGDMSMVGPRPEVPKYVAMYNAEQRRVLSIRPGITDWASLKYFEENELLAQSTNPEETYIQEIMPHKLALNLAYLEQQGFKFDLQIIWATLVRMVRG
jgi:lipopolysaccharide/colanic/teichoic acid biosynthesis glycosyltransferase